MEFTDSQIKWLINLPRVSGTLSIVGSSLIIYSVMGRTKKRHSTFHRILLIMSCFDIFFSFNAILGTLLAPKESGVIGAKGNQATCTAEGLFTYLGLSVPMYNASLSLYYFLAVRHSVREQQMERQYEPFLIYPPILFLSVCGLIAVGMGLFNVFDYNTGGCFIAPSPNGCDQDQTMDCTRGELPRISIGLFNLIVLIVPFFICIGIMFATNMSIYMSVRNKMKPMAIRSRAFDNAMSEEIEKRITEVAKQCFFYVTVFVICYVPTSISVLFPESHYPVLILQQLLLPLQGALNFLVYIRPRYIQARNDPINRRSNGESPPISISSRWRYFRIAIRDRSVLDPEDRLVEGNEVTIPPEDEFEEGKSREIKLTISDPSSEWNPEDHGFEYTTSATRSEEGAIKLPDSDMSFCENSSSTISV